MTVAVKNQISEVQASVLTLSELGKYGEAVRMLQQAHLRSDEEMKRLMKEAIEEKKLEEETLNNCCECCDGICSTNCGYLYCVGTCGVIACCGPDTAMSLCGIDWFCDCFRTECCGMG